jgi:predicted KAP-like P-loop ATPase
VVRFDPWLFSQVDQLVARFFDELAGLLAKSGGRRIRKLGQRLAEYGAALSPAAGVVLGPAGQLLAAPQQVAVVRQASAGEQRQRLRDALLASRQRIVVLIDDIDRLDPREVGEVMRLVKLVADLPGVVHVLSYDRPRVQVALEGAGHEDGRAYLEKIVQVSMAVPPVSKERLRQMTLDWL